MLRVGDSVPDFEVETTTGETLRLSALRGRPVVVFFYPKAFTGGCTIETRAFASMYPEFQGVDAELVGVSIDDLETQCAFAKETGASFPLIGDPEGAVAGAFGVKRRFLPIFRRVTFVLDERGVIERVFPSEMKFKEHAEGTLAHLRERTPVAAT